MCKGHACIATAPPSLCSNPRDGASYASDAGDDCVPRLSVRRKGVDRRVRYRRNKPWLSRVKGGTA